MPQEGVREDLAAVLRSAGDVPAEDVRPEGLVAFLAEVRRRPGLKGRAQVCDSTVFAYHRVLAAFFTHLEKHGILEASPMRRVPKPRVGDYLVKPFTQDQLRALLSQPDTATFVGLRDAAMMCFLLDTGCRVSECLGLTFDALDLERRQARILGKGRRERLVPFGERALAWLRAYMERRAGAASDLVFVNQYGEALSPNAVANRMAGYGRRAGIRGVRVSPHTLRHTFAVAWLMGRGDYKGDALSLQRILGHRTPAMTSRYVNLTGQDLGKLHARLSPADEVVAPPPQARRRRIR